MQRSIHPGRVTAATIAIASCAIVVTGCGSSGKTSAAPGTTSAAATGTAASAPATVSSAPSGSAKGAKCSDLTAAAATAAVGKPTTVALDNTGTTLAGLTICNVTITGEIYPVQLSVYVTANAKQGFAAERRVFPDAATLSGVGDEAFTDTIGVEALSGDVDIKVTGPAGPVLSKNYTVPTALAKAMVAALK